MLALFQLTLRGTIFIYQGQEIGMSNFDFKSLNQVNDVESHNLNKLMKKMFIPGFLRWKWIKVSSRDNGRTPMQWDDGENAGFSTIERNNSSGSKPSGSLAKPWLGINANYKYINYASQKKDPASVLNFYKKLIRLRQRSDCLKYGEFVPVHADSRLMVYQRRLEDEIYTVALNFSSRKLKLPENTAALLTGALLIDSAGRGDLNGPDKGSVVLLPWEGVLFRNIVEE